MCRLKVWRFLPKHLNFKSFIFFTDMWNFPKALTFLFVFVFGYIKLFISAMQAEEQYIPSGSKDVYGCIHTLKFRSMTCSFKIKVTVFRAVENYCRCSLL